jgi:hypothetical protein
VASLLTEAPAGEHEVDSDYDDLDEKAVGDSMVAAAESRLASDVRDMFIRAREAKRDRLDSWRQAYRFTMNQMWSPERAKWLPAPRVAEMYPILAALVGWQIDTQPAFDVTPLADPNSPFSDFMQQLAADLRLALRSAWIAGDYDTELQMELWDSWLYGAGISKVIWDPRAGRGQGDAGFLRVDPFSFYPDPDATSIRDATYLIEYHQLNEDELRARFPDKCELVKSTSGDEGDLAPTLADTYAMMAARNSSMNPGALTPSTSARWGQPTNSGRMLSRDMEGERYHVLECWMRAPTQERGKAFDKWRCVIVCGNVVLHDELAEDMFAHGDQPYDRYVPLETGEFWPVSMAELLVPLQRSVNRLLAAIEQNIWLAGNPVVKETANANLGRTRITNKPGTRLTLGQGGDVDWLQPPQIHPQMANDLVGRYISEMERVSGLSAIVRGATPTGRNSSGVLDSIQEAAFVRIRISLHNLESHLRNQGEKVAALICEFYDEPRLVALIGPSGEQAAKQLHSRHFYLPGPKGEQPMKFQLLVQAGSNIATSRAQRSSEAQGLYAVGAIDEEALLSMIDYPNWQAVVARMRQVQAANGTLGQPPTQRAAARR